MYSMMCKNCNWHFIPRNQESGVIPKRCPNCQRSFVAEVGATIYVNNSQEIENIKKKNNLTMSDIEFK